MTINIKITDSGKNKLTLEKQETYEHACNVFLGIWGIVKEANINLYLDYPKNCFEDPKSLFYKQYDLKNHGGATFFDGESFNIFVDRERILKEKLEDHVFMGVLMDVIAHEIVHVKQLYYKELAYRNGKTFFLDEEVNDIDRESMPHEIEAYSKSNHMVLKYYGELIEMLTHSEEISK
jgi:hypothetical protein